jgi:hypothetical protein
MVRKGKGVAAWRISVLDRCIDAGKIWCRDAKLRICFSEVIIELPGLPLGHTNL